MIKDLIIYTPMYVCFFWVLTLFFAKKGNNRAKSLLGFIMIIAFILYLSHAVFFKKLFHLYQILDPLYIFAMLAVYPLYLWYVKLLTVEVSFEWSNLWYLLPAFVLSAATFITFQFMSEAEKTEYIMNFLYSHSEFSPGTTALKVQKSLFYISRLIFAVQVILCLLYGHKLIVSYHKKIADFYSNPEGRTIDWVQYFLYIIVIGSILSTVFNVIGRKQFADSAALLAIPSFFFSALVFFIGLLGYMQDYSVAELKKDENSMQPSDKNDNNQALLHHKLVELFETKKAYTKQDLKITDVSSELGTNRSYVSSYINNNFSCSFSDFVNGYRVKEAKELLAKDVNETYSLNHIAELAGFGSLGTLIRVFKASEGITPGRYREYLKKS